MILIMLLIILSCIPVVVCAANMIHTLIICRRKRMRAQLWYVSFTGLNGYVSVSFILLYAALFIADYILKNSNHLLLYLTAGAYITYLSSYSIYRRMKEQETGVRGQ